MANVDLRHGRRDVDKTFEPLKLAAVYFTWKAVDMGSLSGGAEEPLEGWSVQSSGTKTAGQFQNCEVTRLTGAFFLWRYL